MNHFADGGCDGGTCTILFVVHTAPLLIVWFLFYVSFVQSLKKRKWTFPPLIIGLALNTLVIFEGFGNRQDELYNEPILLYFVAAICLILYFFGQPLKLIIPESNSDKKQTKLQNIKWFWYITLGIYTINMLYYFGQTLYVLIAFAELQNNWWQILIRSLLMNGLRILAIVFIIKKAKWAYALFALLILYSLSMNTLYAINNELRWQLCFQLLLNVSILISMFVHYRSTIAKRKPLQINQ